MLKMKNDEKNINQLLDEIRIERSYFSLEKFLDMASIKFKSMYKALKGNHYDFVKKICTEEYTKFLKEHANEILLLNPDIDFVAVQHKKLKNYRRTENFEEIDVIMHVYYIDYMKNNEVDYHPTQKKYLEKVYEITFQIPSYQLITDNGYTCDCCGAVMKKHPGMNFYSCDYCGYIKVPDYNEWKISNVKRME